jgi:ribose transport system substrate-binding protein
MTRTRNLAAGAALLATATLIAGCSSSSGGSGGSSGGAGSSAGGGGGSSSSSSAAGGGGGGGKVGKVVYIPGLTGNPFYNTVACGAETEAKKLGVDFSYQGAPTFDVGKQTSIVNSVAATKPGAIMISITDPQAMIAPLTAAKRQGIKIIGIDGDLTDKSVMTTNIQSNGETGGMLAGEALAKAVGYKGDVMAIDNATGSIVAEARDIGFKKAIAKYPNMKFLGIQYSNNDISKAASIASSTASSNSKLVGIFGVETNNTQGALTGVREANKQNQVKVVGYDTSDPIVAALKNGSLTGTVVQNPRGEGVIGVDSAVKAMKGESVPRNQTADAIFVTPATVNSAKAKQYIYDVNCKG